MGTLRNLFKDAEILDAIECCAEGDGRTSYSQMAQYLSEFEYGDVSRQLARYWARQFETTQQNGRPYLSLATQNRQLKQHRKLRVPSPSEQLAVNEQSTDSSTILYFTDLHAPYEHKEALDFLWLVKDTFKPTMVINGGDEVDHHALSFHDADPNLDSAGQELEQAQLVMKELHDLFPSMRICESNHGSLAYRKAKVHGIPANYLKSYREVLFPNGEGGGWSWHEAIRIAMDAGRALQFQHSCKGDLLIGAAHEDANLIVGHEHSKFGIGYRASTTETYWSCYGGSLVDNDTLAFRYGALTQNKPVLGCVIIANGVPVCIPMKLNARGGWTKEL